MTAPFVVEMALRVPWGCCDPAGVVQTSQWFRWFDLATWNYFERGGLSIQEMMVRYGTLGLPIVGIAAEAKAPARAHEHIAVETCVTAWQRKTLDMRHVFRRGATLLLEGSETRIWVLPDPTRSSGIRAADIPAEVAEHFRRLTLA